MPSFVTSSNLAGGRGLSRINSIQRKWDDEDNNTVNDNNITAVHIPSSSQPMPSSSALSWSPSPERERRKLVNTTNIARPAPLPVLVAAPAAPTMIPGESPADRRRRAILEAMSQGSSNQAPSNQSRPLGASKSLPPTTLPELPSLKRSSRPWEENTSAKRVAGAGGVSARTNPSFTPVVKPSKAPTVTVKGKIFLSQEQQKILQLVTEGKNIFFTGSAGTGKSVLLREIISTLRRKFSKSPDAVAVTASTGIAACNIGGVTLHSFGGCGLAAEPAPECVRKIKFNKKAASRWTRTKVLIVDEVSMVDGELFDKFNKIGQLMRKRPDKPFGGIQIIVTGDFFQLPPVTKGSKEPSFCFEAGTWGDTMHMSVNLTKVFRQSDETFVTMLNEMRFGNLSIESVQRFRQLERAIIYDDGIAATELFPRREDVERSNRARLEALNTDGWSYTSVDGGQMVDKAGREKLLSNFMAPQSIFLKVDAQVMLIKNVDETLVNGSMGKVIGFCHRVEYSVDSTGRWREGGLFADIEEEGDETYDDKRARFMENLKSKISAQSKPYPVVRFNVPGGQRDMLVEPDVFKTEQANGEIQVSRTQIPLILAWAMSIHKAQGQTLDRVKVDLSKVFEKGQAYVALSRATSLDGLEVKGFRKDKVLVHQKVTTWSKTLANLNV